MTKLKKIILLDVLFSLSLCFVMAQETAPGYNIDLIAGTEVANVYVPPVDYPENIGLRTVEINVNYIGNWTPAAMGAFDFAVGIWEQILTSDVTIEIDATFAPLGSGLLGQAGPTTVSRDFDSADPQYQTDTWYAAALANRLNGSDVSGQPDITATFSSTFPFYFGIDGVVPADMFDFVTVVLHEIGHGLGFFASTTVSGSQGSYGFNGSPVIYDRFVIDGSGTRLTDFQVGVASTALNDFLTSNDLFWDGLDAQGARLFAPSPFDGGSSISHFDDATYDGTPNALMTHALNFAEAIHDPGALGVGLLRDIGWEAQLITGIEDKLFISSSFDIDCWNDSACPSGDHLYDGDAVQEYDIGDTNYYDWTYDDIPPYSPVSSINWRVELLHSNGRHVYDNGSTGFYFGVTIGSLPSGYQWDRNAEGQIKAEIIISGTGSDGFFHEDFLPITINYKPDTPDVEFLFSGNRRHCQSVILSFYAPGATSYNVLFKENNQSFYLVEQVPVGKFTHEITGLNEMKDYTFIVEGVNSHGFSSSQLLTRRKCKKGFIAFPNPARTSVTVTYPDGGSIKQVNVYNINNNNLELSIYGDNYSNELNLNIASLPVGKYDIEVIDDGGNATNQIIFKY